MRNRTKTLETAFGSPRRNLIFRAKKQLAVQAMTKLCDGKDNFRPCHDGRARRTPGPPSEPSPLTLFRPRKFASCSAGGEARFRGYLIDNVFL